MANIVISIGRQFGSGGKEIGMKLAEKLKIHCYDSELLSLAARESGFCEEVIRTNDEKPVNSFIYNLVMDTYSMTGYSSAPFVDMPTNHKVFLAQFDMIKALAKKEPCVIIGRCADYVLDDDPNCVSIFVHAPISFRSTRVANIVKANGARKVDDYIKKMDKQRSNYYSYYTSKKWGDAKSYDLTLDSSVLGIDKTVDVIIAYLKLRFRDFNLPHVST